MAVGDYPSQGCRGRRLGRCPTRGWRARTHAAATPRPTAWTAAGRWLLRCSSRRPSRPNQRTAYQETRCCWQTLLPVPIPELSERVRRGRAWSRRQSLFVVMARAGDAWFLFGGGSQASRLLPGAVARLVFGRQRCGGLGRLAAHRIRFWLERRGEHEVGGAGGADFGCSDLRR